ncbi:hypothetical protein BGZ57DRAFT_755743 [Hyaloscypha finlandica]|nr:hypothetical protein BGZ57DRAFT_755743 [Hyaloscypha finlandica]
MSDYPSTPSYGASYGARDQTNPSYLPPTYQNQYIQGDDGRAGHMAANYDASMAAYSYNRAVPTFSAAAVASGVPPLPIYQGWNQDSIPLPSYTAPHNPPQYASYGSASQASPQYYQHQAMNQQSYHQNTGVAKPLEQTDLSEGEFEDAGASTNTPPIGYGSNHYSANDGTGYMDTAQRAVYSRAQDYSPQSANYNYPSHNTSQMGRQQSDSYSPYVSPGGADHDEQPGGVQAHNAYAPNHNQDPINGTPQSQYGWTQDGTANRSQHNSYANGYHIAPNADGGLQAPAPSQPALGQLASAANGKSVAEYRKKAQGAILNLLPYDVRYQTYIDEGFKEDIVDALFDDLKMPRTSSKTLNGIYPSSGSQTSNEQRNGTGTSSLAAGLNDAQHGPSSLSLGTNLQQMKGRSIPQASLSPSTNTVLASAPVKSTMMTEKERTLQTKMDALRKSREERAQKAAAKMNSLVALVPAPQPEATKVIESISEKPNSPPQSPTIAKAQPQTSFAQPIPSQRPPVAPQQSNPQPKTQQQPPVIPGLFLASAAASPGPQPTPQVALPTPLTSSQRKRPVAADFDDHLPAMSTFKRPFGYSPHNDGRPSLVIDLSDDEDEDVAMDLDSQADQDSPAHSIRKMSDPRSTNTQNMPPTNPPTRKPFTPPNTSATNTPSLSSKASLGRPEVLIRKESEIEELKKKIAEAEARKRARKTPSGTLTPRASESNSSEAKDANVSEEPSLGSKVAASIKMQSLIAIADNKATLEQQKLADAQTAEIEKAAELKRNESEQKRLRREKIASDLPLVEAEVLQNQTRLEHLRAEMAKIEAAVQKSLEDKQRLAEEMERLGQEAEDQLQEQKDKLNTLTQQESRSSNGMFSPRTYPVDPSVPPSSPPIEQMRLPSRSKTPTSLPNEVMTQATAPDGDSNPTTNTDDNQDRAENALLEPMETNEASVETEPTDQALEAALQEAVRAEADSHSRDGDGMDMEVSYAPDPAQLAPEVPAEPIEEDNRSPEYSPQLNRTAPEVTDRESDGYEPPDATAPTEVPESPPFSPAPPESIHEVADESIPEINSTQAISEDGEITTDDIQPVADDAVLTALGSPDEFTGEQREKFCEGLRQVLMDLRVRKIRDFDIIASEIVAHRSKFLRDKSKVLALEGTTI